MTAISVIIPAYNAEKTLESCLESVVANQFSSLECILVDDGSTDSTLKICKTLESRYPSVRVLTKGHSGLANTRNLGLQHATGAFITFVDADDTLPSNALWLMYEAALETDSDLIIGNHLRKDSLGRLSEPEHFKRWFQCRSNVSLAEEPEALLSVSACGKLYKSSFLKKNALMFPQGVRWGEDVVFVYAALTRTNNFSYISDVVYYYHTRNRNEKNLTNHATLPHITAIKDLVTYCRDIFDGCDIPLYRNIREGRIKHSLAYHSIQNVIWNNDLANFTELQTIVTSGLNQIDPTAVTSDIRLNTVLEQIAAAKHYRFLRIRFFIRHYTHQIMRLVKARVPSVVSPLKRYIARFIALVHPASILWLFKAGLAYLIVKVHSKPLKPVWLIGEREGKSLNDNGFAFFTYLVKYRSDVHPVLVIHPALSNKLPKELVENTIKQGSLQHLIYCRTAEVCAYTHTVQEIVCHPVFPQLSAHISLPGLRCFLDHGIIALHNVPYYSYSNMKSRGEAPDFFIASSPKERTIIIKSLGHLPERVVVTGMPRLDTLHRDSTRVSDGKRRLLFIPTWRQYMERQSSSVFRHSHFFQSIVKFLQSPVLNQFMEQHNLALHWVVHHQFKKHFQILKSMASSRIAIEHMVEVEFSTLLNESLLLITDYSSISFDMASIKKPVIYFQFDQEEFLRARNGTSLNYERDLPGPVVRTAQEVVRELEELATSGFTQKKIYQERTKAFFAHADANNSRRVYEAIKNRLAEHVR